MTGILPEPPRRRLNFGCRSADSAPDAREHAPMIAVACVIAGAGCGGGAAGTGAARRRRRHGRGRRRRGNGQRVGGRRRAKAGTRAELPRRDGQRPGGRGRRVRPQQGRRLHAGRHDGSARRVHGRPAGTGRLAGLERGRVVREHSVEARGRSRRDADVHAIRDGVDRRRQPVGPGDGFVHAAVLGRRTPAVPAHRDGRQAGAGPRRARLLGVRAADGGRQSVRAARPRHRPGARVPGLSNDLPGSGTASCAWGGCSRPRR